MQQARLLVLLFTLLTTALSAQYVVEGKVNMKGDWQHQIYLATVDRLDDYNNANAEFVINVANIDTSGNFTIKGSNLPDQAQFYRLYLVKEAQSEFNACLFVGGDEHNFIHLILDNNSKINITASPETFAPFGDYQITGDKDNQLMRNLANLIYPSYHFYEIKFPSELQFSQNKLNNDLFQFADTCSGTLPALAALNMTDMKVYYKGNEDKYEKLTTQLKSQIPGHPYLKDYLWKLKYHQGDLEGNLFWKSLSILLGMLSLFLAYRLRRVQKLEKKEASPLQIDPLTLCTPQEIKILEAIKQGKSNKEIAQELFIEVSTVKSHINKLYTKLQVSSRKEAIHRIS